MDIAEAEYPLGKLPTLYLVTVQYWPHRDQLTEMTAILSKKMREEGVDFGEDKIVRYVYLVTPARVVTLLPDFIEVPLVYEKKIEYTVSEPDSEDYGDVRVVYSLEKAFIWLNERYKHAILACGDFSAVKPVLSYCRKRLDFSWQFPNLSEEMLKRLAFGARPRTATFSTLEEDEDDILDVQTLTISDPELGESRGYKQISDNPIRQQTAGFYSNHPDLIYGGIGIARRYGRIWTPARLKKDSLLALSTKLVQKTEDELKVEVRENLDGYIGYYKNIPISINSKPIVAGLRELFEELVNAIIVAGSAQNLEAELSFDTVNGLIQNSDRFHVIAALEAHCEHCGYYLVRCPLCQQPLEPHFTGENISFWCHNHPDQMILEDQTFPCECGADLEATFSSDVRIFPQIEIIQAIQRFLANLENQRLDGTFVISGNVLKLLMRRLVREHQVTLSQLRSWRVRARHHLRKVSERRATNYLNLMNRIKEKCSRNSGHPGRETCRKCLTEPIGLARIQACSEICLPRLFGYPINEQFDGVHHGREIADVIYNDMFDQNDIGWRIGIHMKSREKSQPKGLGRSKANIKGLYTQYCYSAYISALEKANLDVIGISVPNKINDEVVQSIAYLARELGYPLIIVDESEWIKIMDAAIETAEAD